MQISTQLLLRASLLQKNPMLLREGLFAKIVELFPDRKQNEMNIMMEQNIGQEVVGFFKQDHLDLVKKEGHQDISNPNLSQFLYLFEKDNDRRFLNIRYDHAMKKADKSLYW